MKTVSLIVALLLNVLPANASVDPSSSVPVNCVCMIEGISDSGQASLNDLEKILKDKPFQERLKSEREQEKKMQEEIPKKIL